ncbi:S9 family peptidase [Schaalia sp. Marseille-Q2122]|uniref:S9 family peptidase n=1 Tax=Schaalia sp. Marseille-Q2122 TaxID=2736604 RepID=UPI0015897CA6|nr:prolyl oligopeptidase family serine peptidase [Schaalia sp. Marseille-Q2122]
MTIDPTVSTPPIAARRLGTRVRDIHGDYFDDPWDWLREKDNPEVIAHLNAENAWTDHVCAPTLDLQRSLVAEFKAYTTETDVSVPLREGDYWYYRRTQEGQSYATHHRLHMSQCEASGDNADLPPVLTPGQPHPGEELLVDENAYAKGQEFFRLATLTPSPDGQLIAWARDFSGDERWTWVIQTPDGTIVDETVTDTGYGLAWSADSSAFIYTRLDEAWRQCELWVHRVGTDPSEDRLLLSEPDEAFDLWFAPSRDPRWVAIHSTSPTTGEAWLWSAHAPLTAPVPVTGREQGVLVGCEPAGDHLLIVHSRSSREGSVAAAPIPADLAARMAGEGAAVASSAINTTLPATPIAPPSTWVSVREPREGERIAEVEAFASFMLVTMRSGSLTQVACHQRATRAGAEPVPGGDLEGLWDEGRFVEVESPVRTLITGGGGRFEDTSFTIEHQSVTVPPTAERVEVGSFERRVLKRLEVPGWDPAQFVEERVWVPSRDSRVQIPVTLIRHRDTLPDGTNAGWIHGYGSYEISFDAEFDILRLPALQRGMVHAIAHIRGGGEMGRAWYEDGKELVKVNTFTDFIDVAQWLQASGWVAEDRLIAEGRSAGGLLMGAVTNMAPQTFRAVLAGVPFVDALTTILDASLPLTVGEWEEWGNPIESAQVYALMRSYTPYENVAEGVVHPAIMATTSLNDTRVYYVEPAKWVQRLREVSASDQEERPIVLRTEMVAGHGGRSGRYGRWEARAEEFAFVMSQVGVTA